MLWRTFAWSLTQSTQACLPARPLSVTWFRQNGPHLQLHGGPKIGTSQTVVSAMVGDDCLLPGQSQ